MATTNPPFVEIVYRHVDGIDLSMDVYVPGSASTAKPAPVLLWWHGRYIYITYLCSLLMLNRSSQRWRIDTGTLIP